MLTRRTRHILIAVTFCVTICGVAFSALPPFDVTPVPPTAQQNQSLALYQERARCVQSLTRSVASQTNTLPSRARKIASERCALLFAADPIGDLTGDTDKT